MQKAIQETPEFWQENDLRNKRIGVQHDAVWRPGDDGKAAGGQPLRCTIEKRRARPGSPPDDFWIHEFLIDRSGFP